MSGMEISLVIATYNSTEHIGKTLAEVLERAPREIVEIIVINDGSEDTTVDQLATFLGHFSKVKAYTLNENLGQAASVSLGIYLSTSRYVIVLDDDLQYGPEECIKLIDKGKQINEFQVIFGSPDLRIQSDSYKYFVAFSYTVLGIFISWIGKRKPVTPFFLLDKCTADLKWFHPIYVWDWNPDLVYHVNVIHAPSIRGKSSYNALKYIQQFKPLIIFIFSKLAVFSGLLFLACFLANRQLGLLVFAAIWLSLSVLSSGWLSYHKRSLLRKALRISKQEF